MKKLLRFGIFILALAPGLALSGCSLSPDDSKKFEGTWVGNSGSVTHTVKFTKYSYEYEKSTLGGTRLAGEAGTYTFDDTQITLTITREDLDGGGLIDILPRVDTMGYSISGNTLYMGGKTYVKE